MQSTIRMEIKKNIQLTYKDHSSAKNLENSERENSYLLGTELPLHLPTLQQQGKEQQSHDAASPQTQNSTTDRILFCLYILGCKSRSQNDTGIKQGTEISVT